MTPKAALAGMVFLVGFGAGLAAKADMLDIPQFLPDGTINASPSGTTIGGVTYTVIGPNEDFTTFVEGTDWNGEFTIGQAILWDGRLAVYGPGSYGPGSVTIEFSSGISSLTLAAQALDYGPYTETMWAYSGLTLVDVVGASAFNHMDDALYAGTVPYLTVTGNDITSVVVATTNDGAGFAIGDAVPVPEPSTYALMLVGFGLIGFVAYRRSRNGASAFCLTGSVVSDEDKPRFGGVRFFG